jgi:hypothetical protein
VSARQLSVLLVAVAALLDTVGYRGLATTALVLSVPVAAVAALLAFGDALERQVLLVRFHATLSAAALALLLVATAVRAPLAPPGDVPAVASSALVGCLGVLALQALLSGLGVFRGVRPLTVARR